MVISGFDRYTHVNLKVTGTQTANLFGKLCTTLRNCPPVTFTGAYIASLGKMFTSKNNCVKGVKTLIHAIPSAH